jgi:hypothetical protein
MINVYCGILMPSWGLYPRNFIQKIKKTPEKDPSVKEDMQK